MENGVQTKDERALADRCLTILAARPGQTTLTLLANVNFGQKKSNIASTDEIFRACASDDRIDVELVDGLYYYRPKETK
jgi:hypothetical protein